MESRNNLNVVVDQFGKDTIKDIDLATDNRWIEVNVGDTIPSNATAIATTISSIASSSKAISKLEVIPTNNDSANTYVFSMDYTTNNTGLTVSSNTIAVKVVNRKISGIYFEDINRNGSYDNEDTLLENKTINLIDDNGKIVSTVKTDSNGRYIFEKVNKGYYVVEFSDNGTNYELISKGTTNTSSKANSNYKSDSLNQTVVSTTDDYVIDNINIGVRKRASVIKVHHKYQGENNDFKTETIDDKYFGDNYETHPTTNIPKNYVLVDTPSNASGPVNQEEINVTYVYKKKDSNVNVKLDLEGTEEITGKEDEISYKIKSNITIDDYIGNGKVTIISNLPYEIDESKSNIDGGTYNSREKTITWTNNKDINTYENQNKNFILEKNIKVVYKNIDSTKREMENEIEASIVLDNNVAANVESVTTNIGIKGTIKVYYYEIDSEGKKIEIIEHKELKDLVGKDIEINPEEIDGYELPEQPNTTTYTFQEDEQVVEFIYEKKKYKITAKAINDGGGVINGEQEIKYNEDSEPIEIKSNEGYYIDSIKINGEKLNIKKNLKEYELTIEKIDEDKNIEVSFKKISINPNTGDNILKFVIIGSVALIILITIFIIKKRKAK